jgi:hypothetical protein
MPTRGRHARTATVLTVDAGSTGAFTPRFLTLMVRAVSRRVPSSRRA